MGQFKFLYNYSIVFMISILGRFLALDKFKTSCSLKIKARPVLMRRERVKGALANAYPYQRVDKICLFWDFLVKWYLFSALRQKYDFTTPSLPGWSWFHDESFDFELFYFSRLRNC